MVRFPLSLEADPDPADVYAVRAKHPKACEEWSPEDWCFITHCPGGMALGCDTTAAEAWRAARVGLYGMSHI